MSRQLADRALQVPLVAAALLVGSVLLLLMLFLLKESWPVWGTAGVQLFEPGREWHPLEGELGLLPMVGASLLTTAGALVLAVPLGIASALFSQYFGPPQLVTPYRWMVGLLAGIPSVVFGLWGLTVLLPLLVQWQPPGASLLAGILILTLMILPTVALTAEAAIKAVPKSYVDAAHALSLSGKTLAWHVLLPAARKGLMAGVVLAAARAVGETMAVLMVTGNVAQWPHSVFDPVRSLAANIALEMAYATGAHRASLFMSGWLLIVIVGGLVLLSHRSANRAI